jgi:hypothetical protein
MALSLSALRTGRPRFSLRKIPDAHFCQPQGHSTAERMKYFFIYLLLFYNLLKILKGMDVNI